MKTHPPISRDVVFIGGGHTHAIALKMLAMKSLPGVRLTLISSEVQTPYSGMLPGLIAGHYSYDETHIDLGRLCRACGVRFIEDTVIGLDTETQTINCKNHPSFSYDILSIDIGSTPDIASVTGATSLAQGVKPVPVFLEYWRTLQQRLIDSTKKDKVRIGTVGGGASAVEVLLAMQQHLNNLPELTKTSLPDIEYHIISGAEQILASHNRKVRNQYSALLNKRGVLVHNNFRVTKLQRLENNTSSDAKQLQSAEGHTLELDEVIWTTAAKPAAWPSKAGLSCSSQGFITVNDALQTLSHPNIFATGDIADMVNHPRPKAGVFAVRQGPPLVENILLSLQNKALKPYKPQRKFLSLVSTGDKYAVASRGGWSVSGEWVWRWKNYIDQAFMTQLNDFRMPQNKPSHSDIETTSAAVESTPMRCGGCGAKVGQPILQRVINQLTTPLNNDVQLGLDAPDDAAALTVPAGKYLIQSVDAFRSMIDDDYLFGQIAANHALGDVFAMGAKPHSAQAIVTLPFAKESKVEQQLLHVMEGATKVFNQCGMTLVGGHTAEGAELSLGFVVNGLADPSAILRKSGLQIGDKIILTKPLGTGALFAADMRGEAHGRWITQATQSMIQLNQSAAECLIKYGAKACTDVTGFGLVGHLVEMLRASEVNATLSINELPLLEGASDCFKAGIVSTLQPQNEKIRHVISNLDQFTDLPDLAVLFDPQTAGGLIAGISAKAADQCIDELVSSGYLHAAVIGEITQASTGSKQITLM
ncbi:selenide, water dikinase SelD [Alkalimarinus alittae]|uniref:Selenide, water dikinase SelD n=1 Tax=Alkalimarinus alittae TaxID=2961619 RepID=A0ABY6N0U3_9ALTE|nr:selenide, water dikinase SelD [Alkalimarinus alittae]UZE95699.1 selenide, water dikinase SelD [Alkalimarinus alittae]